MWRHFLVSPRIVAEKKKMRALECGRALGRREERVGLCEASELEMFGLRLG